MIEDQYYLDPMYDEELLQRVNAEKAWGRTGEFYSPTPAEQAWGRTGGRQ